MKVAEKLKHLQEVMEAADRDRKVLRHTCGAGISEEVFKQAKRDYELAMAQHSEHKNHKG